jgi:hypothetical protein
LWYLPGIITGTKPVTRPSSCVMRGKQGTLIQCPNDWMRRTTEASVFSLQGSSLLRTLGAQPHSFSAIDE